MLLRWVGISSGKSILTKFLPIKQIIQWVFNFLMLFFPTLAPIFGFGKMLIWIYIITYIKLLLIIKIKIKFNLLDDTQSTVKRLISIK